MPVFTSSIEVTADYPTIKPSLNLNFARSRSLDPRITFTRASTATYIGRDGLVKTAGEDEARFDHDPETLESLGLLIEESRTNLISYSQDFTSALWQSVNNRATCDATTGIDDPSGGTTASRWSSGTSTGQELIYRTTGTSTGTLSGQTCTKSIWIRRVSNDGNVAFFIGDNVGNLVNSQLDSVPVGTWVRCTITRTIVGNNGDTRNYIAVYPGTDGQPTTIDIWGDQLEVGSFPTSYIPTSGSTVTRAADLARVLDIEEQNFYNFNEGTYLVEGIINATLPANTYGGIFGIGSGGGSSNFLNYNPTNNHGYYASNTSQSPASSLTKTYTPGTKYKLSGSYDSTGFSASADGDISNSTATGVLNNTNNGLYIGANAITGNTFGVQTIAKAAYYSQRLTDAQLQLLTS